MNEDNSNEVVTDNAVNAPETIQDEPSDPVDEPQIETTPILGKFKSQADLEKAYMDLEKDYHAKNSLLKEYEKPKYSNDQQEIIDQLRELGVATKEDLSQYEAAQTMKAADDAQIRALKLSDSQEKVLRKYASAKDNIYKTMNECWEELSGTVNNSGTVVSRKTVVKPKSGSNRNSGFRELSQLEVARLPEEQYNKYWNDYAVEKANT